MNLKNLLFGTMFVLAFTACSNDDPVVQPEPQPEVKTTLNVLTEEMKTKADEDPSAKINSLQVLVFAESQTGPVLEVVGGLLGGTENQSIEIPVEGGNKTVLVVANYPDFSTLAAGTSRDEVFAKMKDFEQSEEKDGALTMNSQLYEGIVIGLGLKHYLGFAKQTEDGKVYYDAGDNKPVKLYRNVARVNLQSVTVSGSKIVNSAQYTDLKIELNRVYVLHGKNASKLIGQDGKVWGSTFVDGSTYSDYINGYPGTEGKSYMFGGEKALFASLDVPEEESPKYYDGYVYDMAEAPIQFDLTSDNKINFGGTTGYDPVQFYVYENQYNSLDKGDGIKTLLVLKTDFSYKGTKELLEALGQLTEPENNNDKVDLNDNTWTYIENVDFDSLDDALKQPMRRWTTWNFLTGYAYETFNLRDFYCEECGILYNPTHGQIANLGFAARKNYTYSKNYVTSGHECEGRTPQPGADLIVHFDRYYTVAVGNMEYEVPAGFPERADIPDATKATGILRNLQYNINLTITGEGYINDKGDKGEQFLQTLVEVAPWGEVNQEEVIE